MDLLSLVTGIIIGSSSIAIGSGSYCVSLKEQLKSKDNAITVIETDLKEVRSALEVSRVETSNYITKLYNADTALEKQTEQFNTDWNALVVRLNELNQEVHQTQSQLTEQQKQTAHFQQGCSYYQSVIKQYDQALIEATHQIEFYKGQLGYVAQVGSPMGNGTSNGVNGSGGQVIPKDGLDATGWNSSGSPQENPFFANWKPLPAYPQKMTNN